MTYLPDILDDDEVIPDLRPRSHAVSLLLSGKRLFYPDRGPSFVSGNYTPVRKAGFQMHTRVGVRLGVKGVFVWAEPRA